MLETGVVSRVTLNRPEVRNALNDLRWPSTLLRIQDKGQNFLFYAMARLFSDDMIEPTNTRRVLVLSLSTAQNAPISKTKSGLFRMQGSP